MMKTLEEYMKMNVDEQATEIDYVNRITEYTSIMALKTGSKALKQQETKLLNFLNLAYLHYKGEI